MTRTSLQCRECKKQYETAFKYICDDCFGPLDVKYDFPNVTKDTFSNREQTYWRYFELLPIENKSNIVSIDNYAGYDKFTAMDIKGLAIVTSYEEFTNEMRPAEPKRHWAWRHFFNTYAQEDGQEISIKKERKTMLTDFIEIIS